MTGWNKKPIGDLPLYQARTMAWLPRIVQGFTTRDGGVSSAPFDTLNLGAQTGDASEAVGTNRQRLWTDLGFSPAQAALAHAGWRGAAANSAAKAALLSGTMDLYELAD